MNERYVVVGRSKTAGGGSYGFGPTLKEASRKFSESGGDSDVKAVVYKFRSELPFAPANCEAREDEADAYVNQIGQVHWLRCEMEKLEGVIRYAARPDGSGYRHPKGRIYICQTCGEQGSQEEAHEDFCPLRGKESPYNMKQ